ncbi:MAG TPA: NAD(P)/FAD-dependent oxidoreductase [Bryocella sp.]|nr:NAD(P)/FAD-dependent oxidoreductase [Bryocella sp.]
MTKSVAESKHVVIVGGGFAGLHCARKVAANPDVRVTLIDRNNYQQFQPLLYQVASSMLAATNISFNLRNALIRHANVDVKLAEVVSVDLNSRTVHTEHGQQYQGDILVLAAGSQVNFFATPGAAEHAFPLYNVRDAELLRSRILAMLESADADHSLIDKGALNFVIVGAGPTGTEMAGALADAADSWKVRKASQRAFKDLPLHRSQVFLVDAGHAVLNGFSPKAQEYATRVLTQRGVQIRVGTRVTEVGSAHVTFSDGTRIPTHTVIWAGGLTAASLSGNLGIKPGHGGRIEVQPDLSVPGLTGVYALGDFANIAGEDGQVLPQLASVAEQSGKWCARNILADVAGKPREPFRYLDKGIMAMIGRNAAVAEVGKHRHELEGPIAFAAWMGVHAVLLTAMVAKIEAFTEWAWWYFGGVRDDVILDRPEELQINWNEDTEAMAAAAPEQRAGEAAKP